MVISGIRKLRIYLLMVGEHVVAGFALGDILKTSGPGRNSMCLIRIRDHEATEARRQSSFMLLEQVRKIAKGRPTFCTGDFNATPDEEPVQLLLKDSLLLDSYKCTLTPPKGPSGSFYAYDKTGKTAKRIDFIFVTPKIKILSYHTIDDDIKYNKYSSDHFPVMVEALLK